MAQRQTVAVTYDCDHGKCNKEHTAAEGQTPPGIVLTVDVLRPGTTEHEPAKADVYACSRTHVGPAVLAVIDAATEGLNTVSYADDDPFSKDAGREPAQGALPPDADDVTGGNDALNA